MTLGTKMEKYHGVQCRSCGETIAVPSRIASKEAPPEPSPRTRRHPARGRPGLGERHTQPSLLVALWSEDRYSAPRPQGS